MRGALKALFLVFLTIHVPVGVTAVISGALAAIVRKQLGRHTHLALRDHRLATPCTSPP